MAKSLYWPSDYFKKQRRYAEVRGDHWYIQSAKHGLLEPREIIKPYDRRPADIDDVEAWAATIAEDLTERHDGGVVEVLGGRKYADPLTPELEARGFDVVEPLRGLRMGPRKNRLEELTNTTLEGFA